MDNGTIGFFLAFVAFAVVVIIWGARQAAKRREMLGKWAISRNLSFNPERDRSFMDRFPTLWRLRAGEKNRYAYNIMEGRWGDYSLTAFDYHYETTSTDSKGRRSTHSHYFSAAILQPPLPLKPLHIRPEGFFDKVGEFFGFDDIDFESAEFSRRFCVKAADRKWAYDLFHARAMAFLLTRPAPTIQFDTLHVMIHGRVWKPGEFETAIGTVTGLVDMLPEYVRQKLSEGV